MILATSLDRPDTSQLRAKYDLAQGIDQWLVCDDFGTGAWLLPAARSTTCMPTHKSPIAKEARHYFTPRSEIERGVEGLEAAERQQMRKNSRSTQVYLFRCQQLCCVE